MPRNQSFFFTKAGQKKAEQIAASRLKSVVFQRIIPDYVKEKIVKDTERLAETVEMGDSGRYSDSPSDYGIEVPINIGGTRAASLAESKYKGYGDKGVGTSREVDYVEDLLFIRGSLAQDKTTQLFDDLDEFVAVEM